MPKSMGNKTCGKKTAKISAGRTQPAAVLQPGNNFESLAGTFASGISPANIRFRPPADYTQAPAGRRPLATPIFFAESAHHSAGQHLFSRLGRPIFSIFKKMIIGIKIIDKSYLL